MTSNASDGDLRVAAAEPTTLMNVLHPDWYGDPYPLYHALRQQHPVYWDEWLQTWVVLSHEAITRLLKDRRLSNAKIDDFYRRLSPRAQTELAPLARALADMMVFADPPRHTRLRRLVRSGFTPRFVREIRTRIRLSARRLLRELEEPAEFDLIEEYAKPLTRDTIAELTAVPDEVLHLLDDWRGLTHEFFVQSDAQIGRILKLRETFLTRLPTRRRGTGDDLFSRMIAEEITTGDHTDDEVFANFLLLIDAGLSTTTYLLGNAVRALLLHPRQLALLRDDHSRMPGAVTELMRYDNSVQYTTRIALDDLDIEGCAVRRDQSVTLVLGAGNRDPDRYDDPDRLDISRTVDNLSFGHGIHYCLGAVLAHAEVEIGITELLRRTPSLTQVPHDPQWLESINFRFLKRLPVSAVWAEPAEEES